MADIDIQKKSKPVWPWILGVLLLIAVAWVTIDALNDGGPETGETAILDRPVVTEQPVVVVPEPEEGLIEEPTSEVIAQAEEAELQGPAKDFVTFVDTSKASADMGLHHEYTSTGIQQLSSALSYIVETKFADDVELGKRKDLMEKKANQIQKDPMSLKHANMIQDAFVAASNVMDRLQQTGYPDLEEKVKDAKKAAKEINVSKPTLEQKDNVKNFFEESSEVVEAMAVGENQDASM